MSERKREVYMVPGEDAPDCAHCFGGLHEARPTLTDVFHCTDWCETTRCLWGKISVDCPHCGKPNEVNWSIDVDDNTWTASSLAALTDADKRFLGVKP